MWSEEEEVKLKKEVEFWQQYIEDYRKEHGSEPPMRVHALLAKAKLLLEACMQQRRIGRRGKDR